MNKLAATNKSEQNKEKDGDQENGKKEKITLEGWLFYFLLFMTIIGMPAISTIWILSAAYSNPVP